jgi:hypothetical protein
MTCIEFQKGLEPFFDSEANFETAQTQGSKLLF